MSERESGIGGTVSTVGWAEDFLECLNKLFSVLREEVSHLLVLLGVLPSGETWEVFVLLDRERFATSYHGTKGLLPLIQVDESILSDVNVVK